MSIGVPAHCKSIPKVFLDEFEDERYLFRV
jgi:hypothetical protein